jgi:SPP1 family predicted phage head-tail adaptor
LAQQTLSKATTKFVIRWIEGLASKMRVTVDGVSYDVISVADVDGRKRFLTLLGVRNG